MTERVRSQHGNVYIGDFRPKAKAPQLEIPVSVETIYADGHIIVLRCTVGTHTWHMLGDIATGDSVST